MSDKRPDELAALADTDFDLPMTDAFVAQVHRGVRRRRTIRMLTVGGATAAALGAGALVVTLAGQPAPPNSPPTAPAAPAASSTVGTQRPLDGYEIVNLPGGLRPTGPDSVATYAVEENRLRNDGPAPSLDEPTAEVTLRAYERGSGGAWLWITVLRPERTTAGASREQITEWLVGWHAAEAELGERFPVPAGDARLVTHSGTEATTHEVVITTPDGVVISIGGAATVTVTDLEYVASGIRPG